MINLGNSYAVFSTQTDKVSVAVRCHLYVVHCQDVAIKSCTQSDPAR